MVSRNLVICDQEERYAAALAHFFMKTKELALGVQVCNSVAQALRLQEESPIDILLIGTINDFRLDASIATQLKKVKTWHMRRMRNLLINISPERPS